MIELSFDKGTLLVKGNPRGFFSRFSDQIVFDDRVGCYRAEAIDYFNIQNLLLYGEVPFRDCVFDVLPLEHCWSKVPLRTYQESAILAWQNSNHNGIVCLPTGAGKTRIAIAAMAACKVPSLILVPTRILLIQWIKEISKYYPGPLGILGDAYKNIEKITVTTFESAYRNMSWLGNRFKCLVIDEVHHFGQGIRDEALIMSAAPYRLGLTATIPEHSAQITKLNKLIGSIVYKLGIRELAGKHLADLDLKPMYLKLSVSESLRYNRNYVVFSRFFRHFVRRNSGASWQEFIQVASRTEQGRCAIIGYYRSRKIVRLTQNKKLAVAEILKKHRNQKTLIFTADTETAIKISKAFLIPPITADIKRKEREFILEQFREGTYKALVSCKVLNEGIDVPDAEIAIILGGSSMGREYIQRIGRLLRQRVNKRAIIYELICKGTFEEGHSAKRQKALAG